MLVYTADCRLNQGASLVPARTAALSMSGAGRHLLREGRYRMSVDCESLRDTNLRICEAEMAGDKGSFENLLAPTFAFMREDGDVVDRRKFLHAPNVNFAPRR